MTSHACIDLLHAMWGRPILLYSMNYYYIILNPKYCACDEVGILIIMLCKCNLIWDYFHIHLSRRYVACILYDSLK